MLGKARNLYLKAQAHVYNIKTEEDLKIYEDIKCDNLKEVDRLMEQKPNLEVRIILDKVRILYKFADEDIISRVQAGGIYHMRGGRSVGK